MSIFSNMTTGYPIWKVVNERPLTPDEKKQFVYAVVEAGEFGPEVHFKGGWESEELCIPLSSESFSQVVTGQALPADSIKIITLSNYEGEKIYRIKYVEL